MRQLWCTSQFYGRISLKINILNESTRNNKILEFSEDYIGVSQKHFFVLFEQKREKQMYL